MKLEEIKEKHQLERLRARENLRRNEHAFEAEREKLEQQVGQKIAKSEKILEDRERVSFDKTSSSQYFNFYLTIHYFTNQSGDPIGFFHSPSSISSRAPLSPFSAPIFC